MSAAARRPGTPPPFPTDEDALKEAIATIAKEGIRTFVVPESDKRTLH
jgi:hypothetical protein